MADHVYGIDLGTATSAIARLDALGTPQIIDNLDGKPTTPSVVWFSEASTTVVGDVARAELRFGADEVVELVKRHMGEDRTWSFHGRQYTPESISALILRSLVQQAAPTADRVPVVITVPAYFGAKEREATRNAGEIAGLDVLNLVAEPVAAALFYDSMEPLKDKNLLVYDLGGGTFDVTAVRSAGDTFEILATEGNSRLGGADWDRMLEEHLLDSFVEETGDETVEADPNFRAKLAEAAVTCKEALSTAPRHTVRLAADSGARAKIVVTAEEFDELTEPLMARTGQCMERLLDVVRQKAPDFTVDEVILVGGSSRMRAVARTVRGILGVEPKLVDPDLAVAKGAALSATIAALGELADASDGGREAAVAAFAESSGIDAGQLAGLARKTVLNVLPKAIGFKVLASASGESYIDFLVDQHTTIPLAEEVAREYGTVVDGQTEVALELYQQASDVPSGKLELCEPVSGAEGLVLTGIPPLPAGQPVAVRLSVAGDGLISFSATHVPSGKELSAQVRIGVLSQEAIDAARTQMTGLRVVSTE